VSLLSTDTMYTHTHTNLFEMRVARVIGVGHSSGLLD